MPLAILVAALLSAPQAPSAPAPAQPLAAMARCRPLPDPAERARCYDAAWDALEAARARKEVVVIGQEDVRRTRRGMFGFGSLRLPFLGDDDGAPDALDGNVAQVADLGAGLFRFTLADGAVWQTTEPPRAGSVPRGGDTVRITRGAVGNYFAKFGRSSSRVAARRLR